MDSVIKTTQQHAPRVDAAVNPPRASDDAGAERTTIPKPNMTLKGVGISAVLWVVYTLVYSVIVSIQAHIPYGWALISQSAMTICAGLFSIPAWLIVVRQMDDASWLWKICAHLIIVPFFSILVIESLLWITTTFYSLEAALSMKAQYVWMCVSMALHYGVLFGIYHMVRSTQRLRLEQQRSAELRALAGERQLAALKSQLSPHFLFNTLNSINAMVVRDPQETRKMIVQLGDLLRYGFDMASRKRVPLRAEIEFVRSYLELEGRRLGARLEVTYDIEPAAEEALVPPLLLQPLVENAIKHGIAPSVEGGAIKIIAHKRGESLQVGVSDSGVGVQSDDYEALLHKGIGLHHTNERLQLLYGPEAGLRISANHPHGLNVQSALPFITGREE